MVTMYSKHSIHNSIYSKIQIGFTFGTSSRCPIHCVCQTKFERVQGLERKSQNRNLSNKEKNRQWEREREIRAPSGIKLQCHTRDHKISSISLSHLLHLPSLSVSQYNYCYYVFIYVRLSVYTSIDFVLSTRPSLFYLWLYYFFSFVLHLTFISALVSMACLCLTEA